MRLVPCVAPSRTGRRPPSRSPRGQGIRTEAAYGSSTTVPRMPCDSCRDPGEDLASPLDRQNWSSPVCFKAEHHVGRPLLPPFPLSPEQRSMLFLEGLFGPGIFRNTLISLPLRTEMTRARVQSAITRLQRRQEALRSALVGRAPYLQRIEAVDPRLRTVIASPGESAGDLLAARRADRLGAAQVREIPGRAEYELIEDSAGPERFLLVALDHLVCDGHAERVLTAELTTLLEDAPGRRSSESSKLPVGYRQLCEQRVEAAAHAERETRYWSRSLDRLEPISGLIPRPGGSAAGPTGGLLLGQVQKLYRGPALHALVGAVCRAQGATAFSVLAALTAAAIWHRGGPRTLALFTPVSTRQRSGFGAAAGCFVHDRPVVCHIDPDQALSDCFKSVMGQNLAALRFSALSVADLACAVPPLGAALLSDGIDYVQLHVGMPAEAAATTRSAADATAQVPAPDEREPRDLGPFRPAQDLSVTTLRFEFTPEATTVRAFCGGPPGGMAVAESLADDVLALLAGVLRNPDDTVAALVENSLPR
ncbi:condensation domain-containing protein [Streptomyces sp. NPDC059278]|uniref:condensation domain-containing protein n=1 Tax=Streptomyces sp. NPDC059278 TaxID=3346801 RepID=UPI00369EC680